PDIYTLSLHDALPISRTRSRNSGNDSAKLLAVISERLPRPPALSRLRGLLSFAGAGRALGQGFEMLGGRGDAQIAKNLNGNLSIDRKSTRLNSSHVAI